MAVNNKKMLEKIYDIVVIGSSPKVFMKIIEYAATKKVAIIDKSKDLGGNWTMTNLSTVYDVEYGCYLIYPNKALYKYMEEIMHIPLVEYEYEPYAFFGDKKAPFGKFGLYSALYNLKCNKNIRTIISLIFQFIKYPFTKKDIIKYPKNGIRSILDSYDYFIKKYNIDVFHLEVNSVHVSFEKGKSILKCTDNSVFIADKTLMGLGVTGFDKITSDKMDFYIKDSTQYFDIFTFLLLKLKTTKKATFSYVKITNEENNQISEDLLTKIDFHYSPRHNFKQHKLLHRITNITDYSYQPNDANDNYILLSIDTDGWLPKKECEKIVVEHLIGYIKNLNLIDDNVEILEYSFEHKKASSINSIESVLYKYYQPYIETTNSEVINS